MGLEGHQTLELSETNPNIPTSVNLTQQLVTGGLQRQHLAVDQQGFFNQLGVSSTTMGGGFVAYDSRLVSEQQEKSNPSTSIDWYGRARHVTTGAVQNLEHREYNSNHGRDIIIVPNNNNALVAVGAETGTNLARRDQLLPRQRGGDSCQDCGNQAKKDCQFKRCRTCCKTRGFNCSTHIRSTWVPASKRRERQEAVAATSAAGFLLPRSKRAQTIAMAAAANISPITSTSTATSPHSYDSANHQHHLFRQDLGGYLQQLPSEVREQAVFKCIKVTSVDDGIDEYAYQTIVRIGGHLFKGVLTDHGPEYEHQSLPAPPTTTAANFSELHLGSRSEAVTAMALPSTNSASFYHPSSNILGEYH